MPVEITCIDNLPYRSLTNTKMADNIEYDLNYNSAVSEWLLHRDFLQRIVANLAHK